MIQPIGINWIDQLTIIITAIKTNFIFTISIIGVLVLIQLLNKLAGYRLILLGIYPRHILGLFGIIFSPFIHGNFDHLFFNAIPLWLLMNLILIQGYQTFYAVTIFIIICSGIGIWLFGRRGIHIGASALIMGYWGFLLAHAYAQPDVITIIIAGLVVYYLGSLIVNLFPVQQFVSWEGHLIGCLTGILASFLF